MRKFGGVSDIEISVSENYSWHIVTMGKPGRPSKGDRHKTMTSLPRPIHDVLKAQAEATGTPVSDLVADLVARGLGMPEYAPAPPKIQYQQELPLTA